MVARQFPSFKNVRDALKENLVVMIVLRTANARVGVVVLYGL